MRYNSVVTKNRIAIISYHTCPLSGREGKETGGMNIYVLNLALELSKKGFFVDVFTRSQDKTRTKIVQVNDNFRVIHLIAGPEEDVHKKDTYQYIPTFANAVIDFIATEKVSYDVFDCHYYMSGLVGIKIKEKLRLESPLVMTFHTLALMKNLVAKTEQEIESQERVDAEKLLIEKANVIISPSETDKEYLTYLYSAHAEKIYVISPGVDTKIFIPQNQQHAKKSVGAERDKPLLLFVGRIEPLKGIDALMYAVKILLAKGTVPDVALWIIGGDISQKKQLWSKELRKLEALREELGIRSKVRFVGKKSPDELSLYYNAADIVVAPSQYESFGLTALEAMACGTPIITTNSTGVSSILDEKHQALITSSNNPLLLAKHIEFLLTNKTAYKKLSYEVFKKVQDLSWAELATKVIAIYKKL